MKSRGSSACICEVIPLFLDSLIQDSPASGCISRNLGRGSGGQVGLAGSTIGSTGVLTRAHTLFQQGGPILERSRTLKTSESRSGILVAHEPGVPCSQDAVRYVAADNARWASIFRLQQKYKCDTCASVSQGECARKVEVLNQSTQWVILSQISGPMRP